MYMIPYISIKKPQGWKFLMAFENRHVHNKKDTPIKNEKSSSFDELFLYPFLSLLSESNQWPTDYKSVALPAELRRLVFGDANIRILTFFAKKNADFSLKPQ